MTNIMSVQVKCYCYKVVYMFYIDSLRKFAGKLVLGIQEESIGFCVIGEKHKLVAWWCRGALRHIKQL